MLASPSRVLGPSLLNTRGGYCAESPEKGYVSSCMSDSCSCPSVEVSLPEFLQQGRAYFTWILAEELLALMLYRILREGHSFNVYAAPQPDSKMLQSVQEVLGGSRGSFTQHHDAQFHVEVFTQQAPAPGRGSGVKSEHGAVVATWSPLTFQGFMPVRCQVMFVNISAVYCPCISVFGVLRFLH